MTVKLMILDKNRLNTDGTADFSSVFDAGVYTIL
jgi:hypothetical protein